MFKISVLRAHTEEDNRKINESHLIDEGKAVFLGGLKAVKYVSYVKYVDIYSFWDWK